MLFRVFATRYILQPYAEFYENTSKDVASAKVPFGGLDKINTQTLTVSKTAIFETGFDWNWLFAVETALRWASYYIHYPQSSS